MYLQRSETIVEHMRRHSMLMAPGRSQHNLKPWADLVQMQRLQHHLFHPSTTAPSTTAASANMPVMAPHPVSVSAFFSSRPVGVSATLICVKVSGCTAPAQHQQERRQSTLVRALQGV